MNGTSALEDGRVELGHQRLGELAETLLQNMFAVLTKAAALMIEVPYEDAKACMELDTIALLAGTFDADSWAQLLDKTEPAMAKAEVAT